MALTKQPIPCHSKTGRKTKIFRSQGDNNETDFYLLKRLTLCGHNFLNTAA